MLHFCVNLDAQPLEDVRHGWESTLLDAAELVIDDLTAGATVIEATSTMLLLQTPYLCYFDVRVFKGNVAEMRPILEVAFLGFIALNKTKEAASLQPIVGDTNQLLVIGERLQNAANEEDSALSWKTVVTDLALSRYCLNLGPTQCDSPGFMKDWYATFLNPDTRLL